MIVYDAGALVAGDRGARGLWALHRAALSKRISPLVPAGALAQAWRGGPQANLSRLLRGCVVTPLEEPDARAAGALCAAAHTSDVVDASVVVTARQVQAAIVTSDAADLRHLMAAAHVDLTIQEV